MLLRPGIRDASRPVVGAQPTHLRRQHCEAGRTVRVVVSRGEHTGGEGALNAIDRSSEVGDVGVLDDDGDRTEAFFEQPAAVTQSSDRRLKDRSRRGPALTGRLDELNDARPVGRAGLPSTVLGLLFHAAEHAQRHSAQIITRPGLVQN